MRHVFTIDCEGIIQPAKFIPSPNHNSRPAETEIDCIVIHNISLPPGSFAIKPIIQFFQNTLNKEDCRYFEEICNLQVSSHLLIDRQGDCIQFVSFNERAWHAGISRFRARDNCNDFSIGIELVGDDATQFTQSQYDSLIAICRSIMDRYPKITKETICGHSDIAPGRKTDPGPCFNWDFLNKI